MNSSHLFADFHLRLSSGLKVVDPGLFVVGEVLNKTVDTILFLLQSIAGFVQRDSDLREISSCHFENAGALIYRLQPS